jgi:hypothetical protein
VVKMPYSKTLEIIKRRIDETKRGELLYLHDYHALDDIRGKRELLSELGYLSFGTLFPRPDDKDIKIEEPRPNIYRLDIGGKNFISLQIGYKLKKGGILVPHFDDRGLILSINDDPESLEGIELVHGIYSIKHFLKTKLKGKSTEFLPSIKRFYESLRA